MLAFTGSTRKTVCVSMYILISFFMCVCVCRGGRRRKTIKLSRDLSDLVIFTNSVVSQECLDEGESMHTCTHTMLFCCCIH